MGNNILYKRRPQSIGLIIVLLYFTIYLFIPMFFQYFYFEDIFSIYERQQLNQGGIIYSFSILTLFLVLYSLFKENSIIILMPWNKYSFLIFKKYLENRKYVSIFCFAFSIWVFLNSLGDLRYVGTSMAEQGGTSQIVLIVKTIIFFDLTTVIFCKDRKTFSHYYSFPLFNYLMVSSHFIMLGGNWDALFGFIAIGKIFFKNLYNYFFYKSPSFSQSILKYFLVLLLLFPILSLILFLGMSIKRNYSLLDPDINALIQSYFSVKWFLLYLVESFSPHLHSFNFVFFERSDLNPNNFQEAVKLPLESFWYRINLIMKNSGDLFGVRRPFYSGMSQYNFLQLTGNYSDLRQGTSPGVIGSFIYLFGKNIGFFASVLYFLIISSFLDRLIIFSIDKKFSIIGSFLFLLIFVFLFQSPLDLLNIIDNAPILLFLLIIYGGAIKYDRINIRSLY